MSTRGVLPAVTPSLQSRVLPEMSKTFLPTATAAPSRWENLILAPRRQVMCGADPWGRLAAATVGTTPTVNATKPRAPTAVPILRSEVSRPVFHKSSIRCHIRLRPLGHVAGESGTVIRDVLCRGSQRPNGDRSPSTPPEPAQTGQVTVSRPVGGIL